MVFLQPPPATDKSNTSWIRKGQPTQLEGKISLGGPIFKTNTTNSTFSNTLFPTNFCQVKLHVVCYIIWISLHIWWAHYLFRTLKNFLKSCWKTFVRFLMKKPTRSWNCKWAMRMPRYFWKGNGSCFGDREKGPVGLTKAQSLWQIFSRQVPFQIESICVSTCFVFLVMFLACPNNFNLIFTAVWWNLFSLYQVVKLPFSMSTN